MQPAVILRNEENREAAIRRIKSLKLDPENPWGVWIAPHKKIRSLEANSLYWRLVGMVASATGHDRDVLHLFFKRKAFGFRVEQIGEQMVEFIPSSAAVSRGDFSQLIEHVQRFIAEHHIEESA